jgi:hypothetical protein
LSPGSTVFETHQALRASRTVLHRRVAVLEAAAAAEIPDRAGTSAVLPKWTDIRVAISADYDIGSGLTFAFGYHIVYFVQERQPDGTLKTNPRSFVRPFSSRRNRSRPRQTFSATGSDISSKKLCGRSKTSERGHEVWNRRSPFRDGDYQRHRETVRTVVKTKLSAILSVDLQHAFQASPRTAKSSSSMPSSSPRRLSGKRSAHGDATA